MKIVGRSKWFARPPTDPPTPMGQVNTYIIHHDAGSLPTNLVAEEARMRADQNYHLATGYNDIAYAFGVGPSGKVYEGRGFGVQCGATENWNEKSIPIMVMGNYETATPTNRQLRHIGNLVRRAIDNGSLTKNPDGISHRDTKATACPGRNLYAKMDRIRHFSDPPITRFLVTATKVVAGEKRARALAKRLRERGFKVSVGK